ncbi:MAG: hydroxymethylbilane synthase [Acidimicrobiales bacterium]
MKGARKLRVATRGSRLALHQAARVAELLALLPGSPRCEMHVVRTTGDRLDEAPIERIGGQGAFVKEVSAAVLDGRADVAVHSAKDLPSTEQPGLVLAAVPERADPRDALVGKRLEDLLPGDSVATGSARRRAQLAWLRPDLTFCELRGNMARRVERAERVGAGVLAAAALERLGWSARAAEVLEPATLLPQVGQGALAVECRAADTELIEMLFAIDDAAAHGALLAERAFLAAIGGGCSTPSAALATTSSPPGSDGSERFGFVLEGMLASRDGHVLLRRRCAGDDAVDLGRRLAAELLDDAGGRSLEDFRTSR